MTITYQQVAEQTGTAIPPHLEAQATVPIVNVTDERPGGRQGDVVVVAAHRVSLRAGPEGEGKPVDGRGHKVVEGDIDRNSHILNGDGMFYPGVYRNHQHAAVADYGLLVVPEDGTAFLTHTEEHGAIGFSEGTWCVYSQLEYWTELRRAAD